MSDDTFVINRIIAFIKKNKNSLKARFAEQYDSNTQPTLQKLAMSLDDETFYQMIIKEFQSLADRLYGLIAELNEYKEQENRLQPNDPTKETLKDLI